MVRLLAGGIVVVSLAIAAGPQLVRRVQTHAAFRIRVARALAALPLSFEANRGQTDSRVDYLAHGRGYTAFLTSSGSVVALARGRREATFAVRLLGARSDLHAAALAPEQARVTYFRPNRRIVAPTYERVAYRGVYPGIDVVYSGNRRRLEEDWIVHPGASVAPVRLALDGVHTVTRRTDGTLSLSFGSLGATESRPHA